MALALLCCAPLALGARGADSAPASASVLPRAPSPTHTPLVATPSPADEPGYRSRLAAIADNYVSLYYSANLRGALDEARRGLALAEQAGNVSDQAEFVKALGHVHWVLGDSASALDLEQRLLSLADALDNDRLRANAHRTLGTVYRQIGETDQARQHTETALALAEKAGDEPLRFGTLNNLAVFALDAGDVATARRLHEEVLAYRERQGERWDIAGSLSNLAEVALAEGDLPRALDFHERALALRRQIGDRRGTVRSLRQAAGVLRRLGRTDESLAFLEEALAGARDITGHELLRDLWHEITLTRESRGEFAAALAAEREAGKAREALAGERARTRIAELEARHDAAQKQVTIERLEREKRVQAADLRTHEARLDHIRFRNFLLAGGLAGGVALLGTVIWLQRARLRAERAARDVAEQAAALKSRLLRMVSHDIRGPVGNIVVLTEDWPPDSGAGGTDRVQIIHHEARHVLDLAQDLLDAASLDSGGLQLNTGPVDLAAITRSTVSQLNPMAERKGQRLLFHVRADQPCTMQGDEARLVQIVRNLVGNAIKYSPRGSAVNIEVRRDASRLALRVQDAGPGIPAESIPRLFLPYTRLASQPTGGESSHGLGLSIAHELVKLHGGTIRVESGAGATFIVEFPISA